MCALISAGLAGGVLERTPSVQTLVLVSGFPSQPERKSLTSTGSGSKSVLADVSIQMPPRNVHNVFAITENRETLTRTIRRRSLVIYFVYQTLAAPYQCLFIALLGANSNCREEEKNRRKCSKISDLMLLRSEESSVFDAPTPHLRKSKKKDFIHLYLQI